MSEEEAQPEVVARTRRFQGARFVQSDLSEARFTDCDLRGVEVRQCFVDRLRVVGSVFEQIEVSSFAGEPARVVVDGVDVSQHVSDTLDQRHPERVQLRAVRTADDHRAMWRAVEQLWEAVVTDADRLHDEVRRARVAGEWSLVQTVRHLVFAVDGWLGRMLRGEEHPYHPAGLPPSDFPDDQLAAVGLDPEADPSWTEAVAALRERQHAVRRELEGLTDADLTETRTAAIAPPVWGEETVTVGQCFTVLHREHVEHHRYARRDLAALRDVIRAGRPSDRDA